MGIFDKLFSVFKSKPSEIELLDESCNLTFRKVFAKCRYALGQELLDVINAKKTAMEKFQSFKGKEHVQEMIIEEILSLTKSYMTLADAHVDLLSAVKLSQKDNSEEIERSREKLSQIFTLINSLCLQLNLEAKENLSSEQEDIINEATALNNVLEENAKKKID